MAERARPRQTNHTSQETNVLYTFEDGSQVCKSTRIRKRVLNLRRTGRNRMRHRALGERLVFELEEEGKSTIHYLTRKFLFTFFTLNVYVILYTLSLELDNFGWGSLFLIFFLQMQFRSWMIVILVLARSTQLHSNLVLTFAKKYWFGNIAWKQKKIS